LGAKVIKVESPKRPDGYRFVGTYPNLGDQWWELSPLWQAQNFGKESLGLDLSTTEGRELLAQLISGADVVAENFTPRVMESFGFGYDRVRSLNPRIVMVRMPAFGLEGPCRDHVGFAYSVEQVAGLAQNGWEGGPLVQPAGIVDIVNGQHALIATLAALRHREQSGRGQMIEVAQVETVACLTADQVIEYQLTGRCRPRIGNRSTSHAPQGSYPCAGGRWISLTVETDQQWRTLCELMGAPDGLAQLSLSERFETHDELDALLSAWTTTRTAADVTAQLQSAGVAAGVLALLPELRGNPQLVARRYYHVAFEPDGEQRRRSRLPVQFSFGELAPGPAPRLGEHNLQVLEQLGLDADHIDRLQRDGVVVAGLQA
jgi:crotonobetainyl-CoA:carnitine CoA-transferase CaiB-like acyl-CoA transferase